MTLIAGHSFDLSGRCILVLADGTVCSRRWIDIMHTDDTCVGLQRIAHVGALNSAEAEQIAIERRRLASVHRDATRSAGSGGYAPPPTEEISL